jgi:putative phage-type endonuclease
MEQGTEEWKLARLGKVTASRVSDARAKAGTATRANYIADIITERLTGLPIESFTNAYMEWGTANEPLARAAYEIRTSFWVEQVAIVDHPTIASFSASPDGLVWTDGLLEIKCPKTSTHLNWMMKGTVPSEHKNQMLAQLACTGRKWVDFVSFDPRLPDHLQMFVVRFEPDPKDIADLEKDVMTFLTEVDTMQRKLG